MREKHGKSICLHTVVCLIILESCSIAGNMNLCPSPTFYPAVLPHCPYLCFLLSLSVFFLLWPFSSFVLLCISVCVSCYKLDICPCKQAFIFVLKKRLKCKSQTPSLNSSQFRFLSNCYSQFEMKYHWLHKASIIMRLVCKWIRRERVEQGVGGLSMIVLLGRCRPQGGHRC